MYLIDRIEFKPNISNQIDLLFIKTKRFIYVASQPIKIFFSYLFLINQRLYIDVENLAGKLKAL